MDFTFTGEFYKLDENDRLFIYGPASAEILDTQGDIIETVSYTHLTLPTIYSV